MTPGEVALLVTLAAGELLRGSAFASPRSWPSAIVLPCERRVALRADFARWLEDNGLASLAREARSRRVPPGEVLAFVDVLGDEAPAVTQFLSVRPHLGHDVKRTRVFRPRVRVA